MKFSSQEEYGLRCLLRLGRAPSGASLAIPEIARAEGISNHYTAKLLRILRTSGLIKSARGQAGGYILAREPRQILVSEALAVLGGRLFDHGFCEVHTGDEKICTHSIDCSLRSLWRALQTALDQVLEGTSLQDLLVNEQEMREFVERLVQLNPPKPFRATLGV